MSTLGIQQDSILSWLQSIEPLQSLPTAFEEPVATGLASDDRPSKRRRRQSPQSSPSRPDRAHHEHLQLLPESALPSSPPLTMSTSSHSSARKRKASALNLRSTPATTNADDAAGIVPRELSRYVRPYLTDTGAAITYARPKSPPKLSRPSSPKKALLQTFKKPVKPMALSTPKALPDDVRPLFLKIQKAMLKAVVLPHEIRDDIVELYGDDSGLEFCKEATRGALGVHDTLMRVKECSESAREEDAAECVWNSVVHTPMLQLVFSPVKPRPSSSNPTPTGSRFVPAMEAGIYPQHRPLQGTPDSFFSIKSPPSLPAPGTADRYPFMAPASQVSQAGSVTSSEATRFGTSDPNKLAKGESKKVDYAITLEVPDSKVQKVLVKIATEQATDEYGTQVAMPHVNQTPNQSLLQSPIAMSVETKSSVSSKADALVQLGIWIAAWYNRMDSIRSHIHARMPDVIGPDALMPSTLLLDVSGDVWRLYFACDRGDSIDVLGPMNIGATLEVPDLYRLATTLRLIKEWVEGGFKESLSRWLNCEEAFQRLTQEMLQQPTQESN